MSDQILAIAYFDEVIGPKVLYSSEPLDSPDSPDLNRILEFADNGTFVFSFRKYQTINKIFFIDSKLARGGKDLLMISFLIKASYFKKEIVDVFKYLDSKKPILKDFADEIKKLNPELTNLLHKQKTATIPNVLDIATKEFKDRFLSLFNEYYEKLIPRYEIGHIIKPKNNSKKIYILGPHGSGKSTLVKNIEVIQFYNQEKDDLIVKFFDIITENLEIIPPQVFEKPNETGINFEKHLPNSEALIFIFNISQSDGFKDIKQLFYSIIEHEELLSKYSIPIALVGNIFNGKIEIQKSKLNEIFKIKDLKTKGILVEYFPINIMREDDKLVELLRWLVKSIL
jgi:hypothetical protein